MILTYYKRAELSFREIRDIGHQGQNSKVSICHDAQLNAELVIKRIEKAKIDDKENFFIESKTLYLSRHPNVVQLHYACEDNDYIYLAMPFYKNGSIGQLIDIRYLTTREIIRFSLQFLSGLQNIHSKKLIHFDIKPDNILLSDRHEALISDFGHAKFINYDGIAEHDRIYFKQLPPEAINGQVFNIGIDIYQTGITIYKMCNGSKNFLEQFESYGGRDNFDRAKYHYDVKNGKFPDRNVFPSHIPSKLKSIVVKCMEPEVGDRYSSVIEICNDLASIDGNQLDWQYTVSDNKRSWVKNVEEKYFSIEIDDSNNSLAKKKIGAEGREQRITDYCIEDIKPSKIKAFLNAY